MLNLVRAVPVFRLGISIEPPVVARRSVTADATVTPIASSRRSNASDSAEHSADKVFPLLPLPPLFLQTEELAFEYCMPWFCHFDVFCHRRDGRKPLGISKNLLSLRASRKPNSLNNLNFKTPSAEILEGFFKVLRFSTTFSSRY